jgi:hypothetical protein
MEPRLLSSLSRTGRVYYSDDFESYTSVIAEKWINISGTQTLSTAHPFRGKTCACLTTAAGAGSTSQMAHEFTLTGSLRLGFEFWWYMDAALADADNITFNLDYSDGTNKNSAYLSYLFTAAGGNQQWWYLNSANALTQLPGGGQTIYYGASQPVWNHMKAVYDFVNMKYVSLICNEKVLNVAGLLMYSNANAGYPHVLASIYIANKTATIINCYVDDLVLTDQEP